MIFGAPGTENIDFWGAPGIEILICGAPGIKKHRFLVLRGKKILIFGALGRENIDFWCSGDRQY